jgi:hypothetical protein
MLSATIIGSGPNGLSAAIVLASAGINTRGVGAEYPYWRSVFDGRDHVARFSTRSGIIRVSDGVGESFLSVVACFDSLDNPSGSVRASS